MSNAVSFKIIISVEWGIFLMPSIILSILKLYNLMSY